MADGEPVPPKVKRRRRSAEQMLGDADSFQSRFKSGKSGSSASRPPEANDAHADALTLTVTGAARAASAAGLLALADDDGAVTAATANALVTELRGKDLDQALAADAAKKQSHDESDDESDDEEAMVVALLHVALLRRHARPPRTWPRRRLQPRPRAQEEVQEPPHHQRPRPPRREQPHTRQLGRDPTRPPPHTPAALDYKIRPSL
jgi:hypothetical protein